MSNILAWGAGPVWLAIVSILGAWTLARVKLSAVSGFAIDSRIIVAPAAGLLIVCLAFAGLLLAGAIWLAPLVIAAAMLLAILDWRRICAHYHGVDWPFVPVGLFAAAAAFQCLLLIAADAGPDGGP